MRTHSTSSSSFPTSRRGAVIVFAMVMLAVMLGMAAITIDVGAMYNTRADLQNAADAAAMAAASRYATTDMDSVRQSSANASFSTVQSAIRTQAQSVSAMNRLYGNKKVLAESGDVVAGFLDLSKSSSTLDTSVASKSFNAVRVTLRRDSQSQNGALGFTFAGIFGKKQKDISASATAAFDDHVSGYNPYVPGAAPLLPFTLNVADYDYWIGQKLDAYAYDEPGDNVSTGKDQLIEVRLYPEKFAAGNFGLLSFGNSNSSSNGIANDIKNGISESEMQTEIGSKTISYADSDGNGVTHTISGEPGLKSTLEGDIKTRVGDVVAFPVHDQVSGTGANTKYRTVGLRFVRVMAVNLQGGSKYLWVEPVTYTGPGTSTNPKAASSNGNAGNIVLVR